MISSLISPETGLIFKIHAAGGCGGYFNLQALLLVFFLKLFLIPQLTKIIRCGGHHGESYLNVTL